MAWTWSPSSQPACRVACATLLRGLRAILLQMSGKEPREPFAEATLGRAIVRHARDAKRRLSEDGLAKDGERREEDRELRVFVARIETGGLAQRVGYVDEGFPPLFDGVRVDADIVVAAQHEPGEEPAVAVIGENFVDTFDHLRARPWWREPWTVALRGDRHLLGGGGVGAKQVGLKGGERAIDHGLDEALARSEVMEDGGVRDTDASRHFL